MKAKKQTKLWIVIAVLALICLSLTGLTFAWFTDKVTVDDFTLNFGKIELETDTSKTYTTAKVKLTRGKEELSEESYVMPGDKVEINITVKLTSESQPAYYLVYFDGAEMFSCDRKLFFMEKDDSENKHVYATDGATSYKVGSDGKLDTTVNSTHLVGSITRDDDAHEISFVQEIKKSATEAELSGKKTFSCTIYAIQQANMESEEAAYDEIKTERDKDEASKVPATFSRSWKTAITNYSSLTSLGFYKTSSKPSGLALNPTLTSDYNNLSDIAEADKDKIEVYSNTTDATATEIAFVSDVKILAPKSCHSMFYGCKSLTSLDVSNLNTSNVTSMNQMFGWCEALTSLDVSKFDTSNVTDMGSMFYCCKALITLDLSNFNTSNVTDMGSMFNSCEALTSLDVSNFNTSKVTKMSFMFDWCEALTSLDVSKFDTSSVTTCSCMFRMCKALTSLNVSKFDTSNVTDMYQMFGSCSSLTSLDVSKFDTSNVTDMGSMFSGCSSLTTLNVSKFDTSNVTDMSSMFNWCEALTSLDVSKFNTRNVTSMYGVFICCSKLTSLDVSNFDTSNVTNMGYMFYSCSSLTSLDLSNFNTSNVTTWKNMFTNTFSNNYSGSTLTIGTNFTNQGTAFENKSALCSATSLNASVTVKQNGSILS